VVEKRNKRHSEEEIAHQKKSHHTFVGADDEPSLVPNLSARVRAGPKGAHPGREPPELPRRVHATDPLRRQPYPLLRSHSGPGLLPQVHTRTARAGATCTASVRIRPLPYKSRVERDHRKGDLPLLGANQSGLTCTNIHFPVNGHLAICSVGETPVCLGSVIGHFMRLPHGSFDVLRPYHSVHRPQNSEDAQFPYACVLTWRVSAAVRCCVCAMCLWRSANLVPRSPPPCIQQGGPCALLAPLQATFLCHAYHTHFYVPSSPGPPSRVAATTSCCCGEGPASPLPAPPPLDDRQRASALANAMAEIIWRAGSGAGAVFVTSVSPMKTVPCGKSRVRRWGEGREVILWKLCERRRNTKSGVPCRLLSPHRCSQACFCRCLVGVRCLRRSSPT